MNYSRIEVNLLPPELQPGPAVRFALLINIGVIGVAIAFLLVSLTQSLTSISTLTTDVATAKQIVESAQPIKEQYEQLSRINESVENYGRLVALASADYVAMPVIMERLSKVLPDGVIVEAVTNQGTRRKGEGTIISVLMRTSDTDVAKMRRTIENFKSDPMFANSYMRSGTVEEQSLDEFLKTIDVNWVASGPGVSDRVPNRNYSFELLTTIPAGMEVSGLPVLFDQSRFYDVEFKTPPPPKEAAKPRPGKGAKASAAKAKADAEKDGGAEAPVEDS